ncbi:MAG: radical SAM protein [Planctomycetes bacterium]|nr:radical SAM protein [Planctomycetota bacterium]
MDVVLCSTGAPEVWKDGAAGFGLETRFLRGSRRARFPETRLFAQLAAVFTRLGHRVQYTENRLTRGADLYVFCPSLITLRRECAMIARLGAANPGARILVAGRVASALPDAFDGLGVIVVRGEAELLFWKLAEVLRHPASIVPLGWAEDLDTFPLPDWSTMPHGRFRIPTDFWKFPTAPIESSRGCRLRCDDCPRTADPVGVRRRNPEAVAEEIRRGVRTWGFRSFRFLDPLFGQHRDLSFRLAERIARMPQSIQFSIETRADAMPAELLRVLRRAGLVCVGLEIETPDQQTLQRRGRPVVEDGVQRELIAQCRRMGIRTSAHFQIGFPDDTAESVRAVGDYAAGLNPTWAHFHPVTAYPDTPLFDRLEDPLAQDASAPAALGKEAVEALRRQCLGSFYRRWSYWRANAALRWPWLGGTAPDQRRESLPGAEPAHTRPPEPMGGLDLIRRKGLRQDGPHQQPGVADDARRRHTE